MSTTHRFSSLRKKRFALFLCLAVVGAASLILGPVGRTRACAESPVPLRELFTTSQRVVVARAAQSTLLPTEKVDDSYEQTPLRTTFYVTKTLKGEGQEEQVIHTYKWLWGDDRAVPEDYQEGKTLLLFLSKRQEGDGYELSSETYGAKNLSEEDLKIYVKRLEELAAILREEKPDKQKLVEWLVRLIEEPATRWEGAYELSASQEFLNQKEDAPAEAQTIEVAESDSAESDTATAEEASQEVEEEEEITEVPDINSTDDLSMYSGEAARLLTAEQKKRISNIFFGLKKFTDDDLLLFNLVSAWDDDERLVPFLFAELERLKEEPPYYAEQLVTALAGKLQSDTVTRLAERYCEYAAYYDEENAPANGGKEGDEEEKALKGNSTQKRRARLQKFMAEAERVRGERIAMAQ